jgi:hypothetical protein
MANYGYIKIRIGSRTASREDRITAFSPVLSSVVQRTLDDRWKVKLSDFEDGGPTWLVYLPGTAEAVSGPYGCTDDGRAFGEDIGFAVALQDRAIAFRHGLSQFERWAQGCVEEALSQHFGHGIFYDATGRTTPVGPKTYRASKTYFAHVTRNLKKPLSKEDHKYIERFKRGVPEEHWGEPRNV